MFPKNLFSKSLGNEETENGIVLFKIICSVLLTVTVMAIISFWQQPQHIERFAKYVVLFWIGSIAFILALRKSNVRTVAALYIAFIVLLILGSSYTSGGIKAHAIRLLPIVILFSGLTIGRKAMCMFAIIACLGGLLLVCADYYEILPMTEAIGQTPLSYWMYSVAGIFLLYYIEHLSVGRFNKTVVHLKHELSLRKQSEEKYRVIFESFQDVFYQTDMSGNILLITPSIKQCAGYDPIALVGQNVALFYADADQCNNFTNLLLQKKAVYNYELDMLTTEGKLLNILASSHILFSTDGSPMAIEGTLHDITKRKKQENLLKEQNEKLMTIARLQSHIVRKPIANILGIINLIDLENPNDLSNLELIPQLEIASKELDTIIKEITLNTTEITHMVNTNVSKNDIIQNL